MAKTSSLGVEENIGGALAYAFGWISGLLIYLLEKKNKTIRYHAMQSIIVFGGLQILGLFAWIPVLGWIIAILLLPVGLILWLYLLISAFQGKKPKMPIAGDFAEKYA